MKFGFYRCGGCNKLKHIFIAVGVYKCYSCDKDCLCWKYWTDDMPVRWAKCAACRVLDRLAPGSDIDRLLEVLKKL